MIYLALRLPTTCILSRYSVQYCKYPDTFKIQKNPFGAECKANALLAFAFSSIFRFWRVFFGFWILHHIFFEDIRRDISIRNFSNQHSFN